MQSRTDAEGTPTAELLRHALEDVQELARAEVALATKELGGEARDALITAVALAATVAVALCAVAVGIGTLIVGFGGALVVGLGSAAGFLALAAGLGTALCVARWPKSFLPQTRRRVGEDISEMKDHFT